MPYPKALVWVDIETSGLPTYNDFSDVHILEIALIVTDFDLQPLVGYSAVLKMTPQAADAVRANEYVRKMHTTSGLLAESIKGGQTLEEVESEILDILDSPNGEYMIAGSGVGTFDFALLKAKMPKVADKFAYYPFDIGVVRRASKILAGKDVVNPTVASYGETKAHRALADVKAHIEEAVTFQKFFRGED